MTHPIPGVKYLTSKDVAHRLGVTPRTVGKWIESGMIEPTWRTLGGHARFSREYVLSLRTKQREYAKTKESE